LGRSPDAGASRLDWKDEGRVEEEGATMSDKLTTDEMEKWLLGPFINNRPYSATLDAIIARLREADELESVLATTNEIAKTNAETAKGLRDDLEQERGKWGKLREKVNGGQETFMSSSEGWAVLNSVLSLMDELEKEGK
jgi:hypothetical protein